MEEILKYFPNLTDLQRQQIKQLDELYRDWNEKINVVSRKDIDHLYLHHVLHSLAIAKYIQFRDTTEILDFGTGGGFPGIPLAILFPQCRFKLIDRTAKKIKVAQEVAQALGLENVTAQQLSGDHFVVSRAVMPLPDLLKIVRKNISSHQQNSLPNGVICLKGGDLQHEMRMFRKVADVTKVNNWFDENWFREKQVVYVPITTK